MRSGKEQVKTVKLGRLEDGEKTAANDAGSRDKIEPVNPASQNILGLELSRLTDELRARFQIKDSVKTGVLITAVDPRSEAAEKDCRLAKYFLKSIKKLSRIQLTP